ncbi:hypothetical protein SPI_03763 [Niveomyces insectorum RCEF 264]|uniref:Arrestin-like N-terminal domain-containing protein n=1 Tax=Niveomyces insectorum RCEF 264 TaxID=1081102 RepID=A0A162ML70_9HYPO|nr:hypothetical protein SPI_03763 [Niveomyces insectorum RCEF 264]
MPQAGARGGPDLAIALHTGDASFVGGDTIVGHVTRHPGSAEPVASVSIRLCGRAEVKTVWHGGMTRTAVLSGFDLFGFPADGVRLYTALRPGGEHGHENEQNDWPFAVTIPDHPVVDALRRPGEVRQPAFVPVEDASAHPLPPTFSCRGSRPGVAYEASVQYYLEATLHGGGKTPYQAIQPVTVRLDPSSSSLTPITDFRLEPHSTPRYTVRCPPLPPRDDDDGDGGAKRSLGQKMKDTLKTVTATVSPNQQNAFTLHHDAPSVLQLGNPHTVPFRVRADPAGTETRPPTVDERPPPPPPPPPSRTISVKKCTVLLTSTSRVRHYQRGTHDFDCTRSYTLMSYDGSNVAQDGRRLLLDVPAEPGAAPPLDLGHELGLKGPPAESARTGVYPTFTTYNMRNTHSLDVELVVAVAGKDVTCKMQHPVTVLGPSAEDV